MNNNTITIHECLIYHTQGMVAVINDGKVIGFEHEKSTEPDNQSDQC